MTAPLSRDDRIAAALVKKHAAGIAEVVREKQSPHHHPDEMPIFDKILQSVEVTNGRFVHGYSVIAHGDVQKATSAVLRLGESPTFEDRMANVMGAAAKLAGALENTVVFSAPTRTAFERSASYPDGGEHDRGIAVGAALDAAALATDVSFTARKLTVVIDDADPRVVQGFLTGAASDELLASSIEKVIIVNGEKTSSRELEWRYRGQEVVAVPADAIATSQMRPVLLQEVPVNNSTYHDHDVPKDRPLIAVPFAVQTVKIEPGDAKEAMIAKAIGARTPTKASDAAPGWVSTPAPAAAPPPQTPHAAQSPAQVAAHTSPPAVEDAAHRPATGNADNSTGPAPQPPPWARPKTQDDATAPDTATPTPDTEPTGDTWQERLKSLGSSSTGQPAPTDWHEQWLQSQRRPPRRG